MWSSLFVKRGEAMIVHATFHIHPDNKEKAKAELRKARR